MDLVVALGARCDFVTAEQDSASPGGLSFVVHEFVELDDGRRLTVRVDRGFTSWVRSAPAGLELEPWAELSADRIEASVRAVTRPDDEEGGGLAWLSQELRRQGISATAEQLEALPYQIELSEAVSNRLRT